MKKGEIIEDQFLHIPDRSSAKERIRNATNSVISKYIEVTYSGGQNINALTDGGILSLLPHTSHFDTIAVMQMFRKWSQDQGTKEADDMIAQIAFLAAQDYWFVDGEPNSFKKPLIFLRNVIAQSVIRILPIVRKASGSKTAQKQIFDQNTQAIAKYISIGCITAFYSNGTRIAPNIAVADQDIKSGLGSLALMVPTKPIIPALIHNSSEIWPKGTLYPRVHSKIKPVHISIGAPIYLHEHFSIPQDLSQVSISDLSRLRKAVNELLRERYVALESEQHHT